MQTAQVRAIAEVGSIVAATMRHADDPIQIFDPLRTIAPFDAAMISTLDPITGKQRPIAEAGYSRPLASFINREYLSCPTYHAAKLSKLPMRMHDYGPSFYRTRVYRQFLEVAGYQEGVTLVLWDRDQRRVTGLLTMSFMNARAPNDSARHGLDLVAPSLGQLVDSALTSSWLASVIDKNMASFLVDDRGAAVPADEGPGLLDEDAPDSALAATRSFLASDRDVLKGYCLCDDGSHWDRVNVMRLPDQHGARRALLMVKQEIVPYGITGRELDVLTLVARGLSNRAVSALLGTSSRTVGTQVEHLLRKTGCATRAGLAALATEHGLVLLGPVRN